MSRNGESERPDPCENCKPKFLMMAPGESFTCEECGEEWARNDVGVFPADEIAV